MLCVELVDTTEMRESIQPLYDGGLVDGAIGADDKVRLTHRGLGP